MMHLDLQYCKVILAVFFSVIALSGCTTSVPSAEDVKRTQGIEQSREVSLDGKSLESVVIQAVTDDLVQVTVQVIQDEDLYRICGIPTIRDPFGNSIATLVARPEEPSEPDTLSYSFRFAFFATSDGLYEVELENQECAVALMSASARVSWVIKR